VKREYRFRSVLKPALESARANSSMVYSLTCILGTGDLSASFLKSLPTEFTLGVVIMKYPLFLELYKIRLRLTKRSMVLNAL